MIIHDLRALYDRCEIVGIHNDGAHFFGALAQDCVTTTPICWRPRHWVDREVPFSRGWDGSVWDQLDAIDAILDTANLQLGMDV